MDQRALIHRPVMTEGDLMQSFVTVCVAGVLGISAVAMAVELVEETRLADDDALYVRFGEEPGGRLFPKYVLFADRFEERDEAGGLSATGVLSPPSASGGRHLVPSKDGRFVAQVTYAYPDRITGYQLAHVYDAFGRVVVEADWKLLDGDGGLRLFEISDYDGTLAPLRLSSENSILYRPTGEKIPVPRAYDVDFATTQSLAAGATRSEAGALHVWVADLDGHIVWEQEESRVGNGLPRSVRMSSDGSFVSVVTSSAKQGRATTMFRVYGPSGELAIASAFDATWNKGRRLFENGYVYALAFSPDSRALGVALADDVLLFDLDGGTTRYRTSLPISGTSTRRRTLRVRPNEAGEMLVLTANLRESPLRQYADPIAYLVSSDGAVIWQYDLGTPAPLPDDFSYLRPNATPEGRWRPDLSASLTLDDISIASQGVYYRFQK